MNMYLQLPLIKSLQLHPFEGQVAPEILGILDTQCLQQARVYFFKGKKKQNKTKQELLSVSHGLELSGIGEGEEASVCQAQKLSKLLDEKQNKTK